MTTPHYIPLAEIEDETERVRRALRKHGRQLQQQGEIPPEVSEAEINEEMEKHVPRLMQSLHHSDNYPHLKAKGPRHTKRLLRSLIEQLQ